MMTLPDHKWYDSQNQAGWPGFLINAGFEDKGPPQKAFKANLLFVLILSSAQQSCNIKSRMQLLLLFIQHFGGVFLSVSKTEAVLFFFSMIPQMNMLFGRDLLCPEDTL